MVIRLWTVNYDGYIRRESVVVSLFRNVLIDPLIPSSGPSTAWSGPASPAADFRSPCDLPPPSTSTSCPTTSRRRKRGPTWRTRGSKTTPPKPSPTRSCRTSSRWVNSSVSVRPHAVGLFGHSTASVQGVLCWDLHSQSPVERLSGYKHTSVSYLAVHLIVLLLGSLNAPRPNFTPSILLDKFLSQEQPKRGICITNTAPEVFETFAYICFGLRSSK